MRDRVTAPRLVPVEPPPDAAHPPLWCRALGTHPWEISGPMLLLPGGVVRVSLVCPRCGSVRTDRWQERSGSIDGRTYQYTHAYETLLEQTRDGARKRVLTTGKPQPLSAHVRALRAAATKGGRDEADGTALRLVSSRKRQVRKNAR